MFFLKYVKIRGVNPIMAEYVPEMYWFLEYVPEYHIPANGILVISAHIPSPQKLLLSHQKVLCPYTITTKITPESPESLIPIYHLHKSCSWVTRNFSTHIPSPQKLLLSHQKVYPYTIPTKLAPESTLKSSAHWPSPQNLLLSQPESLLPIYHPHKSGFWVTRKSYAHIPSPWKLPLSHNKVFCPYIS